MRIGIMLRHLGSKGPEMGTRVYTENVVEGILERDKKNQYLLIYNDKELLGKYSGYSNVTEIVIRMPTKLLWDQFAIPALAKKRKARYMINTSFNMHEEPIVCSPYDAVRAFRMGKLDYLALGDYLVKNKAV